MFYDPEFDDWVFENTLEYRQEQQEERERVKELRSDIFCIVTGPPCRECEFWDVQGHYCFVEIVHFDGIDKCKLVDKIMEARHD